MRHYHQDIVGGPYPYGQTFVGEAPPAGPGGEMAPWAHHLPFPGYPPGFPWWQQNGVPGYLNQSLDQNRYPSLTFGPGGGGIAMRVPAGFEKKCFGKCDVAKVKCTPQRFGKIVAASFPRSITNSFVIHGMWVGIDPVFAGLDGPVPMDVFAADTFLSNLNTYTAIINQPVIMEIENISGVDVTFYGALILEVVSGPGVHLYGKVRDQ